MLAQKAGIVLTQTYSKELKKLAFAQRFKKRKNGFTIARKTNLSQKLLDVFMLNVPWDFITQHFKLKF